MLMTPEDIFAKGDRFDPTMVSWVMDDSDWENLLEQVSQSAEVTVDLETTGLDDHAVTGGPTNGGVAARIVMASITVTDRGWLNTDGYVPITYVLPLSHPESPWRGQWRSILRTLSQVILDRRIDLINQNVKFDARWIYSLTGVDLSSRIVWDTRISAALLNENRSTSLKEVAPEMFGVDRWDDFDLTTPGAAERVPLLDLGLYAARDTYWTWRLAVADRFEMFLLDDAEPFGADEVENARLGKLAKALAMPAVATLTSIEQRGIHLDEQYTREKVSESTKIRDALFTELSQMYQEEGLPPEDASFAPTSNWFKAWAEVAVARGDLRVTDLTPSGAPQWTKKVLSRLTRQGYTVAEKLLNLRKHTKRLEYLNSWLNFSHGTGRIYTTYNYGSTVTGRLSSNSPNMQQVTKELRPCFVPQPGYVLADIDYSQIELRVAAFVSRCAPMIEAYQTGKDLHRMMASKITGKPESEVTADERQSGKAANFGLLFGMGSEGYREYAEDAYGVLLSDLEAQTAHGAFFQLWEGISTWHSKTVNSARTNGQVTSPIGRVRRLPDMFSGNDRYVMQAERQAINSPVQGFASDLMQMAAASIAGYLQGREAVEGAHIVATVHDSIVVEVLADRWREITQECIQRMIAVTEDLERLMFLKFDVPLDAEAVVGTRWGLSDVGELAG